MFLLLFFVLLAAWAAGWLMFHIAGELIHVLLLLAAISFLVHLFRSRPA
jgi:hypothetical protein